MRATPIANLLAVAVAIGLAAAAGAASAQSPPTASAPYAWSAAPRAVEGDTVAGRFPAPPRFVREPHAPGGWGGWLRALPLKPRGTSVRLHTGALKPQQSVHAAVVDVDTGHKDLQQCADAIMRLRAEWLWSVRRRDAIAFNATGGGRLAYARWAAGERPSPDGRRWSRTSAADGSYAAFRKYLEHVMIYAGTASLEKELRPVAIADIDIGDVFIKGGFPGHAVLVVDVVRNPETGEKRFLLAQSYMPAQDIHILVDPAAADGTPWYDAASQSPLVTPEWTFDRAALRRWPG